MWVWAGPGTGARPVAGAGGRGPRVDAGRRAGRVRDIERRTAMEGWNRLRVFDGAERQVALRLAGKLGYLVPAPDAILEPEEPHRL